MSSLCYIDSPLRPEAPNFLVAERMYRDAYYQGSLAAVQGFQPLNELVKQSLAARHEARERARQPFGRYAPNHELDASMTRGRHQALVHAFRVRQKLGSSILPATECFETTMDAWVEAVGQWSYGEIQPVPACAPPRPEDYMPQPKGNIARLRYGLPLIPTVPKQVVVEPASDSSDGPHAILQNLDSVTREVLDWLWPGRIPLGKLTLLAGDPGLGKSFVTLDIAARVSRGDAWPDQPLFKQPVGGVILLNCEDDLADTIAPRLDKAGADDKQILAIEGVQSADKRRHFSLDVDVPRLEEVLAQRTDTRLVVIDPVAGYCGKVDSHNNTEVRGMLAPLADLARRHRVAIVSVTHLSKSAGTKAVYRAMGSLAFAAAARAVWAIVKDINDPLRRLFLPAKFNLAHEPSGLAYRIEEGRVAWETDPVSMHADDAFEAELESHSEKGGRGGDRREACAWLRSQLANGPLASNEIIADAKEQGISERTLRRAFKEISCRAKKGVDGFWHWELDSLLGQQVGQPLS